MRDLSRYALPLLALIAGCDDGSVPEALADATCRVAQPPAPLFSALPEASSAAVSLMTPGIIWSHNDSGDPLLYALSTDGTSRGSVMLPGAALVDWEDLAIADCAAGSCLYVGDIGDNAAERTEITVYRIPEPAPGAPTASRVEALPMRYPEGPRDAEALFVLPGDRLFVVTKGENSPIELFEYPPPLQPGVATQLRLVKQLSPAIVPQEDRVTGASASRDGEWVALRTHHSLLIYRTTDLFELPEPSPLNVELAALGEAQGEGVALGGGGSVVLTSEGGGSGAPGTLAILWCDALEGDGATTRSGTSSPQGSSAPVAGSASQ